MRTEPDDELWSAIADPSRRRVLDILVRTGEASASWLAGQVPFSRQAVSKHLAVLEEAGLVSRRKQGREVLYRVEAARLDQATQAMAQTTAMPLASGDDGSRSGAERVWGIPAIKEQRIADS